MSAPKMTQAELVARMHELLGGTKAEIERMLGTLGAVVTDTLMAGTSVPLPGIGMIEPRSRAARTGRNPRTGEPVEVPATRVAKLRPGKALSDALAKGNA